MKRRQSTGLLAFGFKKRVGEADLSSSMDQEENVIEPSSVSASASKDVEAPSEVASSTEPLSSMDVGLFVGKRLDDETKRKLLKEVWKPHQSYCFPFTPRMNKGKPEKRYLTHEHLKKYKTLEYSHIHGGLYCLPCLLFATPTAGKGDADHGFLVTKALTKFDSLGSTNGVLMSHLSRDYHNEAVAKSTTFLEVANNPELSILAQLDQKRRQDIEKNRSALRPIVKTIVFLGREGLAFRGHRDDGRIDLSENGDFSDGDGHFRNLLRFRVDSGDNELAKHLTDCADNASYTSKTIQNELIEVCGEQILQNIVGRAKESPFFSVLADETSDVSHQEQLSISIRYICQGTMREDFLRFVAVTDLTGAGLAETILSELKDCGLDLSLLVGQGYDGASAMKGQFSGVQALVKKDYPAALYVHCSAHCLNLTLIKASEVQSIRNCFGTISAVYSFFVSPKRQNCLKSIIESDEQKEHNRTRLVKMCPTRWVEKHESVLAFCELLPHVRAALETISTEWRDHETISSARSLLHSIACSEFLVALAVLHNALSLTLPLSQQLQAVDIDLIESQQLIDDLIGVLEGWRNDSENRFLQIYEEAENLAKAAATEISMPRITNRQRNRNNIPASNPTDYYRRSTFIPFLDGLLQNLKDRFQDQKEIANGLIALIPEFVGKYEFSTLKGSLSLYEKFLVGGEKAVQGEFELWRNHWQNAQIPKPRSAIDALASEAIRFYPNICTLLKILAILPVSTATSERSFSSLKLLKTFLRSRMGEDRLTGLALMYIHKDVSIDVEKVINDFAQKPRKLAFVL